MTRSFHLLALALLATGCSSEAPLEAEFPSTLANDDGRAALATAQVPMRGSFQTAFEFIPIEFEDGVPVRFSAPLVGTGHASHLGESSVSSEQVIDFTTVPPSLVGTTVFIAANGDELHATHTGNTSVPDAGGNADFSGVFTFVGGTGRFSDASGSVTFTGVANVQTLTGSFSLDGTIGY